MKRWWILLLAFGLVFVLAVPVVATPGDVEWCVGHPDHPKCDTPSEDPDPTWGNPCGVDPPEADGSFTVDLGGRNSGLPDSACIDVMSGAGPWTVSVKVHDGTLRGMSVFIRDSDGPGDGCFEGGSCGLSLGRRDIPTENPFTLDEYLDEVDIPEAHVNACNIFSDGNPFGEWAGDIFYVDEEPGIPSPLAFRPSVSGTNDLWVTLTVTVPTYTPPSG
jgi:hypothetical protein